MVRRLIPKVTPRSPHEHHRDATPLELFFDLVFVVAIAAVAASLHHAVVENHIFDGVFNYVLVFFAIWWAWMNFTWFSSAYDDGSLAYKLLTFIQLVGALIIAAGVPSAFKNLDLTIMVLGYVIMRLALIFQWISVATHDAERSVTARRYALGITLAQIFWVSLLLLPDSLRLIFMFIGIVIELLIPIWAERHAQTPWHAEHIQERYGLFTIIVLGESILAASLAIQAVQGANGYATDLMMIIVGGLVILFSMWWIYFHQPDHRHLDCLKTGILWGYGHFFIFGSAAAVGAGISILVDYITHHSAISLAASNLVVTIPVVIFLMALWAIHVFPIKNADKKISKILVVPIVSVLIILTSYTLYSVLLTGLLLVAVVVIFEFMKREKVLKQ